MLGLLAEALSYMVLNTPTFPLVIPPRDLKKRACQKVVEKPNPRHEITRHKHDEPNCNKVMGSRVSLTCPSKANEQDGFATKPGGISNSTPHH